MKFHNHVHANQPAFLQMAKSVFQMKNIKKSYESQLDSAIKLGKVEKVDIENFNF